MYTINITLDICSAVICMILFLSLLTRKSGKGKLRNWFLFMCAVNFFMSLSDIPNWAFEGLRQVWYPAALWSGSFIFWICTSLMLFSFTGYLIAYLSEKVSVHPAFWRIVAVLCAIHSLGSMLSLWNGMFFTVTAENFYQRGSWFWLSQFLPFLIYTVDILIFVCYRRYLCWHDFRILSLYIMLPLLAEIVQMLNYGIALLCISVALAILIIYINIQSEQEQQLEYRERELFEARVDIMRSQIQPHFLYNSLLAIRCLCDEDPAQAKAAILDFAQYLRANMNSLESKAPIPFADELRHTQSYLNLEQKRHRERLCVIWDITCCDFSIPALTMQPIVENAVRYGALSREEGGAVEVHTEETKDAYIITIKDNGRGVAFQEQLQQKRSHVGIKNVRERLAAVCGGTVTIQSTAEIGTTAVIAIPKEDHNEIHCSRR